MFKKALIATASVVALSAPAFAGTLGEIQGTTSTTITGGTRQVTINGNYASEEHTVGAATEGTGASASGSWDPSAGPALTVAGVGGASTNTASATYNTNAVTGGTYLNDTQNSFTGTESTTTTGVFFNY
jgi:hypothetical protein